MDYEAVARAECKKRELLYLCHEHYYHSYGNYNYLRIAVEDYTGRYEIEFDLNSLAVG